MKKQNNHTLLNIKHIHRRAGDDVVVVHDVGVLALDQLRIMMVNWKKKPTFVYNMRYLIKIPTLGYLIKTPPRLFIWKQK